MKSVRTRLKASLKFDFWLIGITTSMRDYRLAWCLNRGLSIRLLRKDDKLIKFTDDHELVVSTFTYEIPGLRMDLFRNRSLESQNSKVWLLPDYRQYDYFLKVHDETDQLDQKHVLRSINQMPNVEFSLSLDPETIRSKENLIF